MIHSDMNWWKESPKNVYLNNVIPIFTHFSLEILALKVGGLFLLNSSCDVVVDLLSFRACLQI